ncbi:MAG: hypothetical protein HY658_02360 [Actinobacteria bacterium]|nr:hypothetical protein [Actinomycetota bacterium]
MMQGRPVRVEAVDQGFVPAAPPGRVFRVLRDPAGYPSWWPGVRAAGAGRLVMPGVGSVGFSVLRERPDVAVELRLAGRGFEAEVEWYLEPLEEGTMVSCITRIGARRRWPGRRVLAYRSGIRRAMVSLRGSPA